MYLSRWISPTNNQGESQDFKYGLLKSAKTGIRLAQIQPGTGNKGIAINLIDSFVTGTQQISYDALSYTWGDNARIKNTICNGKRLAVTETLLQALHRFRHPHEVVTLWIDQICICQERIKERNQQVQLMGKIFKGARKVIVWLGADYDDSKAGMQLAKQLLSIARYQAVSDLNTNDVETHGLPRGGHKRWIALSAILRRPWFWRTYVFSRHHIRLRHELIRPTKLDGSYRRSVLAHNTDTRHIFLFYIKVRHPLIHKKVVLNANVELVLGASMITWDELESIITLLEGPVPKVWQLDQVISALELPFSRINRIRLRHQRVIATPVSPHGADPQFRNQMYAEPESDVPDEEGDDPQLLDLLLMSRGLGATDPRDKIYALLGLSQHDISPDYSMSPESVFTDFALQTVGIVTNMLARRKAASLETSSHHREVRRVMILISCAGRHNQKLNLPSWVPDWTVALSARPLVFGLGKRFAAGGDKLGILDWHPDFGFQLCGKLFDTIAVAGTVHLDHTTDAMNSSPHHLIKEWWEEAIQVAVARIARSPGSTTNLDAFEAMRRDLSICKHGYFISNGQRGRRNSLLDELDVSDETLHSASQTLTLGPTRGRVLFTSTTGYVGLVPYGTREGDLIFIALGAYVPFVLRPYDDGFELIGEAYVQGIMDGEAARMEHIGIEDIMIR